MSGYDARGSRSPPQKPSELIDHRLLAACGIAAPIVLTVGVGLAGTTWDGYSHQAQMISELGGVEAPVPAIQNLTFFVVGWLIAGLAAGLYRVTRHRAVPALVGYFGLTVAALPVFPCDPGCEFVTMTGTAHNLLALSGFVAVIAGIAVFSRLMSERPNWRVVAVASGALAVLALVTLFAWNVAIGIGVEGHLGSFQRVFIATVFLWFLVVGVRMYRSGEAGRSGA